ncbi:MAG: Kelch repeat-containing protein, partial [Planctomycetota bacterium]
MRQLALTLPIAAALCVWGSAGAMAAEIPANSWVKAADAEAEALPFSAVFYLPGAGEFFNWGSHGRHRYEGKVYEVRTLAPAKTPTAWRECFPPGKEKAWAGGKFPNWGCGCHGLQPTSGRTWLKKPWDRTVGGNARVNEVRFVETEDVLRPTRCFTYYQGAYDSKRDRVVYFAGGRTFAYDAQKRAWKDLGAKPPLCCDALAFASMVYDPEGDRMILFGGAYALNPWGGARTWFFDCATNAWKRAEVAGGTEPPLRCNSQMVYDSKNKLVVLFGGDAQDRFLADTWVFDPGKSAWTERKPAKCPPAYDRWAGCFIEKHGLVLLATPTRGHERRGHQGGCWTYNAAVNVWTPLKGRMPWVQKAEWLTCAYSRKDDVVLLHSPGAGTWLYRLDPAAAADPDPKRAAAKPGDWVWNSRAAAQNPGLMGAPEPDRAAVKAALAKLPANRVVEVKYPGTLFSKTWSSATIDTDRGTVIYVGGGHCGYTGTDVARYDVGAERWSFDAPPCFIPFLYNYSAVLFGWDYRMRPQSQHTYRWYAYDPVSKTVVYCARSGGGPHDGFTVQLREDEKPFVYDSKTHRQWTWICDPSGGKFYPPVFGRPFRNTWEMALCTTPQGVFAKTSRGLYRAKVSVTEKKAGVSGEGLEAGGPKRPPGYGGE